MVGCAHDTNCESGVARLSASCHAAGRARRVAGDIPLWGVIPERWGHILQCNNASMQDLILMLFSREHLKRKRKWVSILESVTKWQKCVTDTAA